MMGAAPPLARIELFSKSAAERKDRAQSLIGHLRSLSSLERASLYPDEFQRSLMLGRKPGYAENENASLKISRLIVPDRSCYGQFSINTVGKHHPKDPDWDGANELCKDVLSRGLCDSVTLARGISRRGLLGVRHARAVLAAPDVAMLAVLRWFDLLLMDRLDLVVGDLDFSAAPELFGESVWRAMVRRCRADARLSVLVKPKA